MSPRKGPRRRMVRASDSGPAWNPVRKLANVDLAAGRYRLATCLRHPLSLLLIEGEVGLRYAVYNPGVARERLALVHSQVREPPQGLLQQDARLEPREIAAETEMLGPTEAQVPVRPACRVENARIGLRYAAVDSLVAIGGRVPD